MGIQNKVLIAENNHEQFKLLCDHYLSVNGKSNITPIVKDLRAQEDVVYESLDSVTNQLFNFANSNDLSALISILPELQAFANSLNKSQDSEVAASSPFILSVYKHISNLAQSWEILFNDSAASQSNNTNSEAEEENDAANEDKSKDLDAEGNPNEDVAPARKNVPHFPHGTEQDRCKSNSEATHRLSTSSLAKAIHNALMHIPDNYKGQCSDTVNKAFEVMHRALEEANKSLDPSSSKKVNKKDKRTRRATIKDAKAIAFNKIFDGLFANAKSISKAERDLLYKQYLNTTVQKELENQAVVLVCADSADNIVIDMLQYLQRFIPVYNPINVYYNVSQGHYITDFDANLDYGYVPGGSFSIGFLSNVVYDYYVHDIAINDCAKTLHNLFILGSDALSQAKLEFSEIYLSLLANVIRVIIAYCVSAIHMDETPINVSMTNGKFKECAATSANEPEGEIELLESSTADYAVTMVSTQHSPVQAACLTMANGRSNFQLEKAVRFLLLSNIDQILKEGKLTNVKLVVSDGYYFYKAFADKLDLILQGCIVHLRREFITAANPKDYNKLVEHLKDEEQFHFLWERIKAANPQLLCNVICCSFSALYGMDARVQELVALSKQYCSTHDELVEHELYKKAQALRAQMKEIFNQILECCELLSPYYKFNAETGKYYTDINAQYAKAAVYLLNSKDQFLTCFNDLTCPFNPVECPLDNNRAERLAKRNARFKNTIYTQVSYSHAQVMLDTATVIENLQLNGLDVTDHLFKACMFLKGVCSSANLEEQISNGNIRRLSNDKFDTSDANFGNAKDYRRYLSKLSLDQLFEIIKLLFNDESFAAIKASVEDKKEEFLRDILALYQEANRKIDEDEFRRLAQISKDKASSSASNKAKASKALAELLAMADAPQDTIDQDRVTELSDCIDDAEAQIKQDSKVIQEHLNSMNNIYPKTDKEVDSAANHYSEPEVCKSANDSKHATTSAHEQKVKDVNMFRDRRKKPVLDTNGVSHLDNQTKQHYKRWANSKRAVTVHVRKRCPDLNVEEYQASEKNRKRAKSFNKTLASEFNKWQIDINNATNTKLSSKARLFGAMNALQRLNMCNTGFNGYLCKALKESDSAKSLELYKGVLLFSDWFDCLYKQSVDAHLMAYDAVYDETQGLVEATKSDKRAIASIKDSKDEILKSLIRAA